MMTGDGDVWVERKLVDIRNGKPRYYFRSVKTDSCFWHEPPSGATHVVLLSELERFPFLAEFATGPLGKPLSTIEKTPRYRESRKNVGGE